MWLNKHSSLQSFCDLKVIALKPNLKSWNVNSDKAEFRFKDKNKILKLILKYWLWHIWGLLTVSDETKKPPKINLQYDQSLVSFLDFLYKMALESPNIFFGWFWEIFSDLATLSLARSPAIKACFACFKDCFDRELMGSWIEATDSRSVRAPPYPAQEVACSNLYFGYLQKCSLRAADTFPVVASLYSSEGEKRRPELRLLFAG